MGRAEPRGQRASSRTRAGSAAKRHAGPRAMAEMDAALAAWGRGREAEESDD